MNVHKNARLTLRRRQELVALRVTGAPLNNDAVHCSFYTSNSTYMIWNVDNRSSIVVNERAAKKDSRI